MSQLKRTAHYLLGDGTTADTLTDAYVGATNTAPISGYTQANLMVSYVPKAGQTGRYVDLYIEISPDGGTTYFPISTLIENAPADGVSPSIYDVHPDTYRIPDATDQADGVTYNRIINIPLEYGFLNNSYLYLKVSAREDSAGNHGTISVIASLTGYY